MKTLWFRFLFVAALLSISWLSASGQDVVANVVPSGNVIEVRSNATSPPPKIALTAEHSAGFWSSNFPRLKNWKLPDGEEAIQEVDFRAKLVGDQAELVISVLKGKRFGEKKEIVVTLRLSEGESATVSELKKYGFEPIIVKMLNVATEVANVPVVTNPAQSLRTIVSTTVSTLPRFNVRLINDSEKAISAIPWHTEANGRRLVSSIAQGQNGRPLINSNGEYQMSVPAHNPDAAKNTITLVIEAVIYEDETVEGDAERAETFISFTKGRKKALTRLVPILQSAAEDQLKRPDIAALIVRVDGVTDVREKLENGTPSSSAGIAFSGVVTDLLEILRALEAGSKAKPDAEMRAAVSKIAIAYGEWLDRLIR